MLRSLWKNALLTSVFGLTGSFNGFSQDAHHAKHNMLLYGSDEVYADHLVYKSPHNFQVILGVDFDIEVKQIYLTARENHPNDSLVFLIDPMDIAKIAEAERITGTLLRLDPSGQKEELRAGIVLNQDQFRILYFTTLPLSLAADEPPHHSHFETFSKRNGNSCSIICRPLTMASDSCQASCQAGETPMCRTHRSGGGCVAECLCRGRM